LNSRKWLVRLCVVLIVAVEALPAVTKAEFARSEPRQQSSAPPAAEPPAAAKEATPAKQKKVWTNDDLVALRSPADNYRFAKEAQAAADAAEAVKKAAFEKQVREAGLSINLPSTAEETHERIKVKQNEIADLQEGQQRLNDEVATATAEEAPAKRRQLETINANLHQAQLALEVLQQHLQNLAKAAPEEAPPAPLPVKPQ
jgi:hypothetical protein